MYELPELWASIVTGDCVEKLTLEPKDECPFGFA
jgi:hypothetical protein